MSPDSASTLQAFGLGLLAGAGLVLGAAIALATD
jgi:hypothetical protein